MNIYVICTVRQRTPEEESTVKAYVEDLRTKGHSVFYPTEDAPQDDTGFQIVMVELDAIRNADRIDIFWHNNSKGSHFDLGAALALKKQIKLAGVFHKDDGKSYLKVIEKITENQEATRKQCTCCMCKE